MYTARSVDELRQMDTFRDGTYVCGEGDARLSFQLKIVPDAPLLVFLHGAKTRKVELPWFVGTGMASGVAASRLSFSDPSLELDADLTVGWFAGHDQFTGAPYLIAHIIEIVSSKCAADRVVLVGGSAGGFAAMSIGALLPSSVAVAWNPQTRIEKYYRRFVDEYKETAWKGSALEDTGARHDLVEIYSKPTGNVVLYLQCANDVFHVEQHLNPFRKAVSPSNKIFYYIEPWAEGHTPPPKSEIADWIVFASTHDFGEGFSAEKITR